MCMAIQLTSDHEEKTFQRKAFEQMALEQLDICTLENEPELSDSLHRAPSKQTGGMNIQSKTKLTKRKQKNLYNLELVREF